MDVELAWNSRYAPTPRFIFSGKLSALKASVIPTTAGQELLVMVTK